MLAREANLLEYRRKKYLGQAVVVLLAAVGAALGGCRLVTYGGFKFLIVILALVTAYHMIKELREDLQGRAEGLFLPQAAGLLKNLKFDFGRGIDENTLLKQDVTPGYQVRDCFNVMTGEGFQLEEEWFYSLISARSFSFKQTVFEGVVLAVSCPAVQNGEKGNIVLSGGRIICSGALAGLLRQNGADKAAASFMRLFKAEKADLVADDGKVYFWISSPIKIFTHIHLLSFNRPEVFIRRIEEIEKSCVMLYHKLGGF